MPAKLLIKANDNNVPQSPGRWLRGETVAVVEETATLGSGELNIASFYRYTVTDASVLDMAPYLQTWDMDLSASLIAPGPGGTDDVQIANANVNFSATIGIWTQELVDEFIDGWNEEHPTAGMISLGFGTINLNTRATYIVPASIVVLEEYAQGFGQQQMFKRKIWNVSFAGMNGIQGNGGVDSGTQLQLEAIMEDGRLS
jgi:hypothetical protein